MWEIKGKDNQTKATVYAFEYNGEWMGESYVTITIESPSPINFEIGDYVIYRDERFEINYDPGKIKSAPRYAKGDAFKYENIKFNSLADELTRCDFLDVVLDDNQLHFTGLPKFSFYGGVKDLANRIQANLNRAYPDQWTVVVSSEYSDTKELNVSVDTQKVWDALSILVNNFETYFTIKGRTITIGAAGVPAGHLFKYGKGNGLYEIEQTAETDQAIITRLRAYGSTRNLPHRYYNSLTGADGQKLIPDNMAVQYLMLPSFPYTTQDPHIDSANKTAIGIREGTVFFDGSQDGLDEIYPSIEGMTADQLTAAGVPCNSTGALDEIVGAEQMTDNGIGDINEGETETTANPPTFKITLKDLGFDINDHLTTETATLSFKTGMLGGRDFEIVGCEPIKDDAEKVTGYELELNRVYDDSIKLWFPYKDYNAKAGDKFVLLYIEMPEVYIKAAAQRLLEAATVWLAKNDYSRSIYAPKVDEIFMARQHDEAMASGGSIASLHDTLKEGMMLLFEDEDFNIDASIFIDRLTIKEGDGSVPTYEVVLKEEKTVGRLDKMQNQIDSLATGGGQGSGGYNASQIRSLIDAYGGSRFLSKLKDDRAKGLIASDMGFDVGQFLASVSGGRFGIDKVTGQSFLEVDRIFARVRAYFESLTVVERESLAGEQMVTPGGGVKCTSVEEVRDGQNVLTGWRCYFLSEQDGEKRETKIKAGDQAIAQTFNAKAGTTNKVSNHRWWRLVTGVSNNAYTDDSGNVYGYIEVSATDCEADSDIPKEGDDVIQFGNRTDKTRQAAILISTVASDAPSIKLLTGIDHYSLVGKDIISQGYDAAKGHAYFRCYGDTYIGAPDGSTYVKFDLDANKTTVKADLEIGSTIGGKGISQFVSDLIPEIPELTQEDIEDYVNNIVNPKIEGIQNQIDGVIETWFYNGVPTLTNYPASDWNTDALKVQHLGDLYYDNDTGTAYRFSQKADKSYYWNVITDDAITKALAAAQKAQDTADGKRRTFTSQPTPPYDKGDIWVNATYPAGNTVKDAANGKYVNDILRCNTSRATGSFAIGDWGLASNYTDDTAALAAAQAAKAAKDAADAAQSAANAAQSSVTSLNNYVDGAFKDGIIDETEASGIANYINIVNADKERIDGTYQTLYANAYLSATGKAALKTAHDDVAAKITALINAINNAIADNKVTAAESAAVDSAFSAFSTSNNAFSAAVETANAEIQKTLKSAADAAKTAADNAKATADNAQSVADAAKDRLDSWAADGVISPTEKQAIKDEIARIKGEKADIAAQYTKYGGTTPQAYLDAYDAYYNQLVALSASTPENITIPATFASNQTQYYTQRTVCVKAIADLASAYADKVAKEEAAKATDPFKYLRESLLNAQQESTEISGGLILSTMMALGYTENGVKKILSGMNGSYVSSLGGRTIASWYGGHMLDLFDKNDNRIANPTGQEATSLIRMDGSFYFANGNIGGRTDGSGWLAGDNITWDASGAITFGNGIKIDLGGGNSTTLGGIEKSLASVVSLVNSLSNVLIPVNASGARVAWDSADLWAVKSVKGFYSEEFVSARGMNGQSSSISKYLTDLLDVGISAPSSGQALVYNGSKWVNQAIQTGLDTTQLANYLTTNNYAKKSDIPSLANYVTLDTAQTINANKTFVGSQFIRMKVDTSNAEGIAWKKTDGTTTIAGITYHNTNQNLILNSIGSSDVWSDAVGKYSLFVGNNKLTYNTYPILHTGNYAAILDSRYVTALGTSGNYLTWTKNGATNNITVPYATRSGYADVLRDPDYHDMSHRRGSANINFNNDAGLHKFLATTSMTTGKPTEGDSHILHVEWDNSLSWAAQIALPTSLNASMQWRQQSGTTWQSWRTLLDTSNFNTLIGSNLTAYVKKAGDTMTGALKVNEIQSQDGAYTMLGYGLAISGYAANTVWSVGSLNFQGIIRSSNSNLQHYRNGVGASTIWDSYNDGSGSGLDADLLDGVHNGEVTAKKLTVVTPTTVGVTVSTAKTNFLNAIKGAAFGNVTVIEATLINNWDSDTTTVVGSSGYSAINVTPRYDGNTYGQFLLFHYGSYNPKLIGRNNGAWTAIKTFAFLDDTVANANSLGGKAASQYVTTDTAQTITGTKTFSNTSTQSIIINSTGNETFMRVQNAGSAKSCFGWHPTYGTYLYHSVGAHYIGIRDNGSPYFDSSLMWHAGNDGSGSGLDADLLDGYHATSFARLSSANATVGASNRPVYLNAGTVTAVSSVGEAFLSWGGQNYSGDFGPLDAAITPRLGANRLAFANPNGTTFQYSTDGGASWLDYGLTATQKRGFFDGAVGTTLTAGKAAAGAMTTNHQLRVIINTGSAQIYTVLNKFIINVSTNGVSGLTVTIERALQSTPTSFVTAASNIPLSGWSGFNVVNVTGFTTYGNTTTSQYGVIRFTFKCTGAGTNKNPFYIYSIMGFGGMGWTTPSNMALNGHLYSYDGDQNAVFPAKVTATSFAGSLSGNASSATQLQTARTLWGQSFNGTGNVSGSLSSVGNIGFSNGKEIGFNAERFCFGTTGQAAAHGVNVGSLLVSNAWADYTSVPSNGIYSKGNIITPNGISSTSIKIELDVNNATTGMGGEINRFGAALYLQHRGANATSPTGNLLMVCNGGNVGIGTASPTYKLHVSGSILATSWIRTSGAVGWYNETYGGGWYMTDSTWIRGYNSKSLYMGSGQIRTDNYFTREGYVGTSWNNGYGAYNVAITSNTSQTPLMVAYRAGQTPAVTGANRLFSLELLNSGGELNFGFGGTMKFRMSNTGVFYANAGIYSDGYVSARGQNTSSDERLKNILRPLSLNVRDIANAPSVEFIWKKDGIKDVGSIAQYWRKLIPQLAPNMPDGSMGLQYGKTALMSVIAVAKKTVSLEERIAQLERENRELKAQISQLKTQLA
jgi:hypothetical protein